jgi:hypothetical protein
MQWFDGAILSSKWKEAAWAKFALGAHDHARRSSSYTAIASFARDVKP